VGRYAQGPARGNLRKALFWLRQALADTEALTVEGETVGLQAGRSAPMSVSSSGGWC
jgi:DNA-binding SARP family transcriptional activator